MICATGFVGFHQDSTFDFGTFWTVAPLQTSGNLSWRRSNFLQLAWHSLRRHREVCSLFHLKAGPQNVQGGFDSTCKDHINAESWGQGYKCPKKLLNCMENQVKTQTRMSIWPKLLRPERPAKSPRGIHVAPVARSIGSGKYVSRKDERRRSTGKQTKRQRREHQVYISLSRVAEQVSSRPTHAWEMWFCKTWQIPQHRTKIIKMCKTNILSPRRQAPHPSSQRTNIASYCNNGKPKQHIYHSTFTEPEMCRRYIWALTRPPSPPFDVAHVESDSGCLWCHKPMCDVFMITAMCHHSSHGTSTSHLYIYLQCFGDTHEQKEGLQRRNSTTKKRPNMEAPCLTPHHLAILRRQRTSSRRTEFARTFARC